MNIISVNNLSKTYKTKVTNTFWRDLFFPTYKTVRAVDDVNFEIKKGESVALLGPNGAGKTTIMKMMTGLIYPTSGTMTILGHNPFDRKKEFLMKIGLVMGNKTGLDWDLTPLQSFDLIRRIYKIETVDFDKRLKELTEMLTVSDQLNTQVRKLSLGERMKVELIGAILHKPDILYLDEPTIGLDIVSRQAVREFLRQIQTTDDVTLLLTSHDMDDVDQVCDRVIVINKGKKVYDDKLNTLVELHNKDRYIKFIFNKLPDKESFSKMGNIIEESKSHYTLRIEKKDLSNTLGKVTSEFDPIDIDILSVPLEEIMAKIYRK